mgnify:CR=1 FL=1
MGFRKCLLVIFFFFVDWLGDDVNFQGPVGLLEEHGVEVVVVNDEACISMMREFIEENGELWDEDIGK